MSETEEIVQKDISTDKLTEFIEKVSAEEHLTQLKKIAKKLWPLVFFVRGIAILSFAFFLIIVITQIVQWGLGYPLSSFMLTATPWLREHNYLLVGFSVFVSLTLWFGCGFFKELELLISRVCGGAVFVTDNSKALFKMAKYYLFSAVCYFPASVGLSFETASNCQDISLDSALFAHFYEFVFSDLLFVGTLFILAHVITLAIRLDYEQRLTV